MVNKTGQWFKTVALTGQSQSVMMPTSYLYDIILRNCDNIKQKHQWEDGQTLIDKLHKCRSIIPWKRMYPRSIMFPLRLLTFSLKLHSLFRHLWKDVLTLPPEFLLFHLTESLMLKKQQGWMWTYTFNQKQKHNLLRTEAPYWVYKCLMAHAQTHI